MREQKIVKKNERRMTACAMPFVAELALLPYHVLKYWSDSLVPLQKVLLQLLDIWNITQYPIPFTDNEVQKRGQD